MKNRSFTAAEDVETDENVPMDPAEVRELCQRRGIPAETRNRWIGEGWPAKRVRAAVVAMIPDPSPETFATPALHLAGDRPVNVFAQVQRMVEGKQPDGIVAEMSDELDRRHSRMKRPGKGFRVPSEVFLGSGERAAVTTTSYAAVVNVEPAPGLYSHPLRANTAVGRSGAMFLNTTADMSMACGIVGMTSGWVDEGEAPADSAQTAETKTLGYKGLTTTTVITRKMDIQSNPPAEFLFREDGKREIACAVDRAVIAGTGTSGQPRGILNDTSVPVVALDTNGRALAWVDIPPLAATVANANVGDDALGFLTNHRVKAAMQVTPRASGQAKFILDDAGVGDDERLAGYKLICGGNVPANLTKGSGSNLSAMIFGNWRELIIAQFGAIDIIVDPYTESAKGNIRISILSAWDCVVRRPQAFVIVKDIVA